METRSEGLTLIMWAVLKNNKEALLFLLEDKDQKKSLDFKNFDGKTAVFLAIFNGYHDILKILLKAGANPNIQNNFGWTPLMQARFQRSFAGIEILLECKADTSIKNFDNQTIYEMNFSDSPFITPIVFNKSVSLKNLLMHQTPASFDYLIRLALRLKKHECLQYLLEKKPDLTKENYLEMALYNDDFISFEFFLKAGANPNTRENLLHSAVYMKKYRYIIALLEFGADMNVVDQWGETPLTLAIKRNDSISIKLLAEKKPSLSFQNKYHESGLSLIESTVRPEEKKIFPEKNSKTPEVMQDKPTSKSSSTFFGPQASLVGGVFCVASALTYHYLRRGR